MAKKWLCGVLVAAAASSWAWSQEQKVVAPEGAPQGRPYSPAIQAGNFVYLSGAVGLAGGGNPVPDFETQVRSTLDNLSHVLAAAGIDRGRVVESRVYLTDPRRFAQFNRIYREYFPHDPPVRTTVGVDLGVVDAAVEISMTAARPGVELKRIRPEGWGESKDFAFGIQAGDTVFVSGMVSSDPSQGKLLAGDVAAQTRRTLQNVGTVLQAAGLGYRDVVACRVYLDDTRDFQAMNRVYATFFRRDPNQDPPARATVRARPMHPDLKVEIQCTAVRDSNRKVIAAEGVKRSTSPLSPSILSGGRQFLSGMVGRGPHGFAAGDVEAQVRQTLANLRATLEAAGLEPSDVVEATVFLTDVRHYALMNDIYKDMFPDAPPARATVGTGLMSPAALVEIMLTAQAR